VLASVGNQIDLNDQLEYILSELETHKQAIVEDITNGA
jgi:translation initiation factor 6 (eIF-6)